MGDFSYRDVPNPQSHGDADTACTDDKAYLPKFSTQEDLNHLRYFARVYELEHAYATHSFLPHVIVVGAKISIQDLSWLAKYNNVTCS